jgi:hypothetical protein
MWGREKGDPEAGLNAQVLEGLQTIGRTAARSGVEENLAGASDMRWPRVRLTVRRMMSLVALGLTLGVVVLWASGARLHRPRPAERFTPHPEGQANSTPVNSDEMVFLGTVTRIDNTATQNPLLRWVVTLKIDKMIQGNLPMETFQLAIHSPSQEGVELGHQYRISVRKSGAGYDYCGRHPWLPVPPDLLEPK